MARRPATPEAIREAAVRIRRGDLVIFPTETVYGLGASAFDPAAVARIFEAKERPSFDPLIVHIADPSGTEKLWASADPRARALADRFWPGPLTIVLPKTDAVPGIVTAGLPTVAVRLPAHPVAKELIALAGPIAAPSANRFGKLSPTTAEHAEEQLGDRVGFILDAGPCPVGVESTVVDLSGEVPAILRPGGIPVEAIREVLGRVEEAGPTDRPLSPGQLPRHYMPKTPMRMGAGPPPAGLRVGLLAFRAPRPGFERVEVLSPAGSLREAAARFFACLYRLDAAGLDLILAEPVPEEGLGRAIMDRLKKACQG